MDNSFDVKLHTDRSLLSHLPHPIRVGPLPLAPAAGQPLPKKAKRWLQVATGINRPVENVVRNKNPREFLCSAGNLLSRRRQEA